MDETIYLDKMKEMKEGDELIALGQNISPALNHKKRNADHTE